MSDYIMTGRAISSGVTTTTCTWSLLKLQAYFSHIKKLQQNFLSLGLLSPVSMLPEAVTD